MKEKRLNLEQGPFSFLKASNISLTPNTSYQAMRQAGAKVSPQNFEFFYIYIIILMFSKFSLQK